MSFSLVDRFLEVSARPEMPHAPCDPLLPLVQARLGLAADPLDLHGVGAAEAHAVEDRADPPEVDAPAVTDGREVPVLEAAAAVLDMDVADEVLDLLELVGRVEAPVVIADVAGVEVEP